MASCTCHKVLGAGYVRSEEGSLRPARAGETPEFLFSDEFHARRYEEGGSPFHDFIAFGERRPGSHRYADHLSGGTACSDVPSALAAQGGSRASSPGSSGPGISLEDLVALTTRCIRCRERDVVEGETYCVTCFIDSKLECAQGLRHFARYLADWAAFRQWEQGHPAI